MKYLVWTALILIPLLLAVSCGPAPEATTVATPTEALEPVQPSTPTATLEPTQPPTATAEVAQADSPTSTPIESSTQTPTASSPTATAAAAVPSPMPASVPQAGGTASFSDNLAIADQFVLELTGLSELPDDQAYQGWLVGDDGTTTSVGLISPQLDGSLVLEWNSPNSENLLGSYSHFQITLEPPDGSPSPTGQAVLVGGLEGETLTNARRLFVKNDGEPATPLDTAFTVGLNAQADVAVQHVQNAVNAAAIGALPEMRVHLEHVVNILEGAAGPRFDDHDGNGVAENPGDGFGVIGYSSQIAELLSDQESVAAAAADVQTQTAAIQDKCLEILLIDDLAAATAQLGELQALADQLKSGPVTGLYQATQDSISFEANPVE